MRGSCGVVCVMIMLDSVWWCCDIGDSGNKLWYSFKCDMLIWGDICCKLCDWYHKLCGNEDIPDMGLMAITAI